MGTRGLTCVFENGKYRVAQYGQWDHYPSGQGAIILSFLRGEPARDKLSYPSNEPTYGTTGIVYDEETFLKGLQKCRVVTPEEAQAMWDEAGAEGKEWVGMDVCQKMQKMYPTMERCLGALILPYIQKQEEEGEESIPVQINLNFAGNSLFCEWAYVIDYDTRMFEVYEGCVKSGPAEGRFAEYDYQPEHRDEEDRYYPVRLAASWSLDDLPTLDEFIRTLTPPVEDDE